jgi:hypothetical protein
MLSTKNIPTGSGMSKSILPGAKTLKINSITLETVPYDAEAYQLVMHCETEPIDGLDGFFIDKDDPSKGKHLGQIGRIKAGMYAFSNGVTKSGIKIDRDRTILQFVKNLACELGFMEWFEEQDNKFNTIEDFIAHLDKTKPFKNIYFNSVVCGKEYEKNGYINYDLYFPRFDKMNKPFERIDTVPNTASQAKLYTYDADVHIRKLNKQTSSSTVEAFEGMTPVNTSVGSDFDL